MPLAKGGKQRSVGATGNIAVGQHFYAQMFGVADQLITDYGMVAALRNSQTGRSGHAQ